MNERFLRARGARPFLLAHRGSHRAHPENSLAAFAEGMNEGADGVELDVRLCATGEVVVFHDDSLARLTGDARPIARVAKGALPPLLGGGEIPLLDEALDVVLAREGVVNVEVKHDPAVSRRAAASAVRRTLSARAPHERAAVFLSTFDPILYGLLLGGPPVALLFDVAHARKAAAFAAIARPSGLHPHHALVTEGLVDRTHRRGAFVNTWTVDAPTEARRLSACGVDAVITNDVPALVAAEP